MSGTPEVAPLRDALRRFLTTEFTASDLFFCVVYGSYAYGRATQTSDLDLLIVSHPLNASRQSRCVDFVVQLHSQYGLKLDFEVPYEKKVIVSLHYIEEVCEGMGFKDVAGRWVISEIVKTPDYLRSDELLRRFLLATMNHKHIFIAGDRERYRKLRARAAERLLCALSAARDVHSLTIPQAVSLVTRFGAATGDYYLGFDDSAYMQRYLRGYLASLLNRLSSEGKIHRTAKTFFLRPLLVGET